MTSPALIESLLNLPDLASQKDYLTSLPAADDCLAGGLKQQADRLLYADVRRSLDMASLLLHLGALRGDDRAQALGLLAEANAYALGGLGQYTRAIEGYDQAAALYARIGCPTEQAGSAVGKVYALAMLGRYDEALEIGQQARAILEAKGQWRALLNLSLNLAVVHGRSRNDELALAEFDRIRIMCQRVGGEAERLLPLIEQDRAIVLRNLGRFQASIAAAQTALHLLEQAGQTEIGHVQQNLAATYVMLGRFSEALALLDQAHDTFLAAGRPQDAVETDMVSSYCLLQLRRLDDALKKCRAVRAFCAQAGLRREVAETFLHEAMALVGLHSFELAQDALAAARALFQEENNRVWTIRVDIERAALLHLQGRHVESQALALQCADDLHQHGLPVQQAVARLAAARAAAAQGQLAQSRELANAALATASELRLPELAHQAHTILAADAEAQDAPREALRQYDAAIQALEQLQGRVMLEFRSSFLQDKQAPYQQALRLCLELDDPLQALEYAERAKSRALVDMLAFKLDLGVSVRKPGDQEIVRELEALRDRRDRLYRRWQGTTDLAHNVWTTPGEVPEVNDDVIALETRMTQLWHKLLIRNADYAQDLTLWQVHSEPIQPLLDGESAVLEYFATDAGLVAFVVSRDAIHSVRLEIDEAAVRRSLRRLHLNFAAAPRSQPADLPALTANARGVLEQLYSRLVAPVAHQLAGFRRIVVVPHGALHYLPFQALYDGQRYLVQQFELARLPVAGLLRFSTNQARAGAGVLALGNSSGGRLPHAVREAQTVADLCGGQAMVEEEATAELVRNAAGQRRVLHLAVHGEFRPDNPLFSGLALADGWLTTLDIFNLRLNASLVTLSACQTGQSVVGGGDELLGLMRAFFAAGASSLVLSQWSVEDRSTAALMTRFYANLMRGASKGEALRLAQMQFIDGQVVPGPLAEAFAHPYFWAPFFLVGDGGPL